jgi:uncharacterized protein DUF4054
MTRYGFPDIAGFYDMLYGTAGVDFQSLTILYYGGASGMVFPGNPPYTVTDFLGVYAKFFGPPSPFTGLTLTQGSAVITGFTSTVGIQPGQLVVNLNSVPKDTLVISTTSTTVTLSNQATANDTTLTIYEAPFIPIIVVKSYVQLALASLMFQRYQAAWMICMAYFVAHYCTLFMRSESGTPNATAAQVAASGLTKGIIIHRAAGDVSASSKIVEGYEQWGAWGETQYGELFMTIARATNCGPVWVP